MSRVIDKLALVLGIALAVVVCLMWLDNKHMAAELSDLKTQQAGLKADKQSTEVHEKGTVQVLNDKEKAHVATEAAIASHPEWADEPLPDDVAGLLRQRTGDAAQ